MVDITIQTTDEMVYCIVNGGEEIKAFEIITEECLGHPYRDELNEEIVDYVLENTAFIHITSMKWLDGGDDGGDAGGSGAAPSAPVVNPDVGIDSIDWILQGVA